MNLENLSTKELHEGLKSISNINKLIMKGTYPGVAFLDIKDASEFIEKLHTKYLDAFKVRPDAVDFEPNIHKVGTAEIVGA